MNITLPLKFLDRRKKACQSCCISCQKKVMLHIFGTCFFCSFLLFAYFLLQDMNSYMSCTLSHQLDEFHFLIRLCYLERLSGWVYLFWDYVHENDRFNFFCIHFVSPCRIMESQPVTSLSLCWTTSQHA